MNIFFAKNIMFINVLLIAFLAVTILHALHSKDSFEKKILNVIMMVVLPLIGSVVYCFKVLNRANRDFEEKSNTNANDDVNIDGDL